MLLITTAICTLKCQGTESESAQDGIRERFKKVFNIKRRSHEAQPAKDDQERVKGIEHIVNLLTAISARINGVLARIKDYSKCWPKGGEVGSPVHADSFIDTVVPAKATNSGMSNQSKNDLPTQYPGNASSHMIAGIGANNSPVGLFAKAKATLSMWGKDRNSASKQPQPQNLLPACDGTNDDLGRAQLMRAALIKERFSETFGTHNLESDPEADARKVASEIEFTKWEYDVAKPDSSECVEDINIAPPNSPDSTKSTDSPGLGKVARLRNSFKRSLSFKGELKRRMSNPLDGMSLRSRRGSSTDVDEPVQQETLTRRSMSFGKIFRRSGWRSRDARREIRERAQYPNEI